MLNSDAATLYLANGATIEGGLLSIGHSGEVDIKAGPHSQGATFDNVDVFNNGIITFGDGGAAPPAGGSPGEDPDLFIGGTVTLHGTGELILAGAEDYIIGARGGGELDNDSNIVGAGHIGNGDHSSLTFDNEAKGVLDATGLLVIDTGRHAIDNTGKLKATDGGTLEIKSDVNNRGGVIGGYGADALVQLFGVMITEGMLATGDPYWRDDGVIEVVARAGHDLVRRLAAVQPADDRGLRASRSRCQSRA